MQRKAILVGNSDLYSVPKIIILLFKILKPAMKLQ